MTETTTIPVVDRPAFQILLALLQGGITLLGVLLAAWLALRLERKRLSLQREREALDRLLPALAELQGGLPAVGTGHEHQLARLRPVIARFMAVSTEVAHVRTRALRDPLRKLQAALVDLDSHLEFGGVSERRLDQQIAWLWGSTLALHQAVVAFLSDEKPKKVDVPEPLGAVNVENLGRWEDPPEAAGSQA